MNSQIRRSISSVLLHAKRAVNSRNLARKIATQYHTSIYRVWGNISFMKKTGAITFIVRKAGGPSYIV